MTNKNETILQASIDAVIYMKNGERKYGILLEHPDGDCCQFISNTSAGLHEKTACNMRIERLSCAGIEAIDIDLK